MDDVLRFELPTFEDIEAFCDRLRPRWPGWSLFDEPMWLWTADLSGAAHELPRLLREAQDLVAELGLSAISFWLDGRVYILEATRRELVSANRAATPEPKPWR
jgi:hypothetical protein